MKIPSVQINRQQIQKIAEVIKGLPDSDIGLNFYSFRKGATEIVASDMYPALNHPKAIDLFSFVSLHNFGFWHGDKDGYEKPLIGVKAGKEVKGSDLLWKSLKSALDKDERVFDPNNLASMSKEKLAHEVFIDDNGKIPFQDFDKRLEITRAYGQWFEEHQTNPKKLVETSNNTDTPLKSFLDTVQTIPGFSQDPLAKKSLLLAMSLANRPEKFLNVKDPENWQPVVDYHLMRLSLRMGLVEINDSSERDTNENRQWTSAESEHLIRKAVYEAVQELIQLSGKPMSLVDSVMWMARRYCPEMTEPECPKCIFSIPCKKDTKLFQPVLRTIDY